MESIIRVRVLDDFQLELEFNTGEKGLVDVTPYLSKGVFVQLRDVALFKQAYVAIDTVCWPGGLDISPATLYDRAKKL
jgi:hypothetical protein